MRQAKDKENMDETEKMKAMVEAALAQLPGGAEAVATVNKAMETVSPLADALLEAGPLGTLLVLTIGLEAVGNIIAEYPERAGKAPDNFARRSGAKDWADLVDILSKAREVTLGMAAMAVTMDAGIMEARQERAESNAPPWMKAKPSEGN